MPHQSHPLWKTWAGTNTEAHLLSNTLCQQTVSKPQAEACRYGKGTLGSQLHSQPSRAGAVAFPQQAGATSRAHLLPFWQLHTAATCFRISCLLQSSSGAPSSSAPSVQGCSVQEHLSWSTGATSPVRQQLLPLLSPSKTRFQIFPNAFWHLTCSPKLVRNECLQHELHLTNVPLQGCSLISCSPSHLPVSPFTLLSVSLSQVLSSQQLYLFPAASLLCWARIKAHMCCPTAIPSALMQLRLTALQGKWLYGMWLQDFWCMSPLMPAAARIPHLSKTQWKLPHGSPWRSGDESCFA